MSGEMEAAGAMATAGLVAGAIEKGDPGSAGEGGCLNCGAPLSGRYCSNCGQSAAPHRTLGGLVGEFAANLWNFDTKMWRTLPMVLFRPGTLTRNYVYGKRARYVSPLATFLLSIFLFFFAFSFIEAPVNTFDTPEEQRAEAVANLAEAREELAQAERELTQARAAPDPDEPAGLEERLGLQAISLARAEVARREAALARVDAEVALAAQQEQEAAATAEGEQQSAPAGADEATAPAAEPAEPGGDEAGVRVDFSTEPRPPVRVDGLQRNETWQDGVRRAAEEGRISVSDDTPELNERVRQRLMNPDLALYQIQEAASKFSFLLAPLSLPFIALLFLWKRGVTFYDHVVYALYALSFAALLFVAIIFTAQTPWTTGWLPGLLIGIGWPVHTFFQLGGAYKLGWFSALWRTLFMLVFSAIVALLFLIFIVILGLAG
jgi:hypothetical protein